MTESAALQLLELLMAEKNIPSGEAFLMFLRKQRNSGSGTTTEYNNVMQHNESDLSTRAINIVRRAFNQNALWLYAVTNS